MMSHIGINDNDVPAVEAAFSSSASGQVFKVEPQHPLSEADFDALHHAMVVEHHFGG